MSKRNDDKATGAAHIKRNTKGTSNEISFSVLDAAKDRLDEKDAVGNPLGSVSLFTLPGRSKGKGTPKKDEGLPLSQSKMSVPTGLGKKKSKDPGYSFSGGEAAAGPGSASARESSSLARAALGQPLRRASGSRQRSTADEVAARKTKRRAGKLAVGLVAAVVVVALVGSAGMWLFNRYQDQQDFKGLLASAYQQVAQTDGTFQSIDEWMSGMSGATAVGTSIDDAQARVDMVSKAEGSVTQVLAQAAAEHTSLAAQSAKEQQKEPLDYLSTSVSARTTLFAEAKTTLTGALSATTAASRAREAYQLLLEGDSYAKSASSAIAEMTNDTVTASRALSEQARDCFTQAQEAISQAQEAYPRADLSAYASYAAKRVESQDYAIAADDAFISRDKTELSEQNDAYNAADAEAASMAESLPADPAEVVSSAFDQETEASLLSYNAARTQSDAADGFLRDYLGASLK